jgi:hypothetical protein
MTKNTLVSAHYIIYCFHFTRGYQCLQYCIQISTVLSLAYFILPVASYWKNCRSAEVKDGIVNVILRNYMVDQYRS